MPDVRFRASGINNSKSQRTNAHDMAYLGKCGCCTLASAFCTLCGYASQICRMSVTRSRIGVVTFRMSSASCFLRSP